MKNRWNRPNEYIETETGTLCKVYNYTDSIIRIIPNNTEMNNHTVYT